MSTENISVSTIGVPFHPTHEVEEVDLNSSSKKIDCLKLFGVILACLLLLVVVMVVLYVVFSTTGVPFHPTHEVEEVDLNSSSKKIDCLKLFGVILACLLLLVVVMVVLYVVFSTTDQEVLLQIKTGSRVDNSYPKPPSGKSGRDLLDLKKCGKSSKQHIAHGEIAKVFEFPWMALLGNKQKKFHCGGSLIAESFVLTAAHCSRFTEIVRLGETDLSKKIDCINAPGAKHCADPYQDIKVAQFIEHKLYSLSKKKNNIALVKLAQPAHLNDNVRPVCLPLSEMLPEKIPLRMMVSGWGYTEFQNQTSNELRYANLPIVKPEQCQRSIDQLKVVFKIDESHVCTGGAGDLKDKCRKDSGGPLQYFERKGTVIHGVVSWGLKSCGTDRVPGVYTKVSHYLGWIIDNLK